MKTITVYKATTDQSVDGYGSQSDVLLGYFTTEPDATYIAKGSGAYKQDGTVKKLELVVYENAAEYTAEKRKKDIQKALDKLTPEERRLLNL